MNIKEISSKKLFKEYLIEVPYSELDNLINLKINEIIPTITLAGFRKGKAPLNIVKKKYENNVLKEILEKLAQEKTNKVLEEKKLIAYRQPKVEIKKYIKNKPVEFGIKVDLQPEIKIFPFNKINLKKYKIVIDKKTIEENYNLFLSSQKKYVKLEKNRSIKYTDKVFVNIKTKDDSVPDFIKSQDNISIVTDSDFQVLPDISNQLIKVKAKSGDKIKLKFDLKEILKEKNEKIVEFDIEILNIEENIKFKVDKEFLIKNSCKNENELRNKISKKISEQYENLLIEIEKKQLMDTLEEKNIFDIPEGMLDEEFNIIWHRVEHAKKDNKLDEDDIKLSTSKLKERYKKIAFRRVKLAIFMQHIAKKQNILVSEKELTDGMLNYASQYPGQEKQIFDYFKENPESIESIRGPIFEKKIVDFILTQIQQKEKKITVNDFKKLQEDTFNYNKEKNERSSRKSNK